MNEDFEKSTGEIKKIEEPDMILMDSCPVCGSDWLENYIETNLTNFFFPVSEEIIHKVKKERFTLNI